MRLTRGSLSVLAEPNFRRFFVGHAVSLLGDGMVGVALSFAVLDLTHSSSDLGDVLAARALPMVAVLLFGGVIADRFPRRRVMIAADLARFLGQGVTAALVISGHARLGELMALQAACGAASAIFNPAITGLMPSIADADRLQQANALRGLAISASYIVGPAIAGVVAAASSPGWAIAADAVTYTVSAAQLARLALPPHRRPPAQPFLRDLRDGWAELRSRTWLWAFTLSSSVRNMCYAAFLVLGPAAVATRGGPAAWAALVAALGAGSLLGGAVALRIRPRRPLRAAALALAGFAAPAIGLAAHVPIAAVACFCLLAGAGTTVANTLEETALQHHVERGALSRISAFELFGSLATQPLGQAGAGPAAAALGTYPTLWLAGLGQLASVLVIVAFPAVRRLPARPPDPPRRVGADPVRPAGGEHGSMCC
jgi:predicted MFS family arabinose efflux permease